MRIVHGRLENNPAGLRRLMDFAIRMMKSQGLCGMHSVVRDTHISLVTSFVRLNFEEVASHENVSDHELIVLARPF